MCSDYQNSEASPARVDAAIVVVLYHPGAGDLANLSALATWGVRVIAVVNAIRDKDRDSLPASKVQVIYNPTNVGLARALNQGIAAAIDAGSRYVLLLDQDSRPTRETFETLLAAATEIEKAGRPLACVAPVLRDRKATTDTDIHTDSTSFATSGTMLTQMGWNQAGPMLERLFIDGIDHEWCFRARARGLETVLVREAVMEHDMGEDGINLFGRYRPIHRSPARHYFIIRNTLWLAREPHIPARWRLSEVAKLAYRVPTYLLASHDRARTVGSIMAAVADGLGRTDSRQPT
jgi:rhamnosyltransferase